MGAVVLNCTFVWTLKLPGHGAVSGEAVVRAQRWSSSESSAQLLRCSGASSGSKAMTGSERLQVKLCETF